MNDSQIFKKEIERELNDLLNWWMSNMTDEENGGFYGRIDGHGNLHSTAEKGIILNTRILWTFAAAARQTQSMLYLKIADRAWEYIHQNFIDPIEGGIFWMLNARGEPTQTKKQIYAQAFAIYAFSEYYLLTQNKEAKRLAIEIFWLIEKYSFDNKNGGYFEAFSRDWQLLEDLRLSEKDANEAKTMNTHLHILEAYTNLYRIEKSEPVQFALKRLIECFLDKFIDEKTHHLNLFFNEKWNLKSSEISFGHDIECSWLLWEAAEVLDDADLKRRVFHTSIEMAEATLTKGLDEDGSVFNELNGTHLDTDKHWWPQAEAVVGFWNAFELTQKSNFQNAAFWCWTFIKNHLKDVENGEWHWRVNQRNEPYLEEDKAGAWKAPYHNGRMCLEILNRI